MPLGSGIKDASRRSSPASNSQAGPAAPVDNPEGQLTPEPAESPGRSARKGTKSGLGLQLVSRVPWALCKAAVLVGWAKQDGRLERSGPEEAIQDKVFFWAGKIWHVCMGGRFKEKKDASGFVCGSGYSGPSSCKAMSLKCYFYL